MSVISLEELWLPFSKLEFAVIVLEATDLSSEVMNLLSD